MMKTEQTHNIKMIKHTIDDFVQELNLVDNAADAKDVVVKIILEAIYNEELTKEAVEHVNKLFWNNKKQ